MRVLFVDFTTGLETIDDLRTRARGGMISSLFLVPNALSKLNTDCSVWSDVRKGDVTPAGVRWFTVEDYDEVIARPWDFLVMNRGIGNGYPEIKARHRILWTHDLVHGGFAREPENLRALSATVFMSNYAERIWRIYYPQIGRSFLIPNGVDKARFYPREKDLDYLIYISAPNRGLKRLVPIFETLQQKLEGGLRMRAYSNMKILHPHDQGVVGHDGTDDIYTPTYQTCAEVGIEVMDPIPQYLLAEELGRAGLMVLPTGYPEICSNSILQSLASGTPVVTTGSLGSAWEWIRDGWNGGLTRTHLEDYAVHLLEIMRWCNRILEDEKLHCTMIRNAPRTKGLYSWEEIGSFWRAMFQKIW